jgi:hypothetical protein
MPATIRSDPLNRRILNHGAALLSFFPLALKAGQYLPATAPNPQQGKGRQFAHSGRRLEELNADYNIIFSGVLQRNAA